MSDLLLGARCFLRGFALMGRPGIRPWAFLPMLVSAVLYGGLFWWAASHAADASAWLEDALPSWLAWLGWVVWVLFWVLAVGVVTFTFVIVASVVASPFNGPLAEATERALTSEGPPGSTLVRAVASLPRVLVQETKKVLYAVVFSVPFLVLFLVPVVNVVAPVLWFLWNAWVAALAYTDYALDNNGLLFHEMRRLLGRRRQVAWGFGAAAMVAFTVPGLNLLAVPAAVCGGTVMWIEVLKPSLQSHRRT